MGGAEHHHPDELTILCFTNYDNKLMKKLICLLPFVVLTMASCSNSEDVAQKVTSADAQELRIFPAVQGTTRGAVETTTSLSTFKVIINGNFSTPATTGSGDIATPVLETATKTGSSWNLSTNYYWANDVTTASFTAYANSYADVASPSATQLVDLTVPTTLADQKDLIVAYNNGKKGDFSTGVPLHFRHTMAQIAVNATYSTDNTVDAASFPALKIKVKGFKFVGLNNVGTLTLPTASTASGQDYDPIWSNRSGSAEYEASPSSAVELIATTNYIDQSEAGNPLLLLPQTTAATTSLVTGSTNGAYMLVEVDINKASDNSDIYPQSAFTGNGGTGYAWIAVPVNIDWKGGYKYTYTLNFSNVACGKAAPGATAGTGAANEGVGEGTSIISGVNTLLTFLVTVETAWIDGGAPVTPAL